MGIFKRKKEDKPPATSSIDSPEDEKYQTVLELVKGLTTKQLEKLIDAEKDIHSGYAKLAKVKTPDEKADDIINKAGADFIES